MDHNASHNNRGGRRVIYIALEPSGMLHDDELYTAVTTTAAPIVTAATTTTAFLLQQLPRPRHPKLPPPPESPLP